MLFGILRASRASKEAGHANIQALVGDFSAGRLLLWSRETVDEPSGHELLAGHQGRLFLAVQKNDWLLGCPVDPLRRQIRLFVPPVDEERSTLELHFKTLACVFVQELLTEWGFFSFLASYLEKAKYFVTSFPPMAAFTFTNQSTAP